SSFGDGARAVASPTERRCQHVYGESEEERQPDRDEQANSMLLLYAAVGAESHWFSRAKPADIVILRVADNSEMRRIAVAHPRGVPWPLYRVRKFDALNSSVAEAHCPRAARLNTRPRRRLGHPVDSRPSRPGLAPKHE